MIGRMIMLVGLCVSQAAGAESPFSFRDVKATRLALSENGKPVFVYNYGMILCAGVPGKDASQLVSASGLRSGWHTVDRRLQSRSSAPSGNLLDVAGGHRGRQTGPNLGAGRVSAAVCSLEGPPSRRRPRDWRSRTAGMMAIAALSKRTWKSSPTGPLTNSGRWILRSALRPWTGRCRLWERRKGKRDSAGSVSDSPRGTAAAAKRSFAPKRGSPRKTTSERPIDGLRSPGPFTDSRPAGGLTTIRPTPDIRTTAG